MVSEGAAQSMLPVVLATVPEVDRAEGDMAGGSPSVVAVVERTSGESSSTLMSGGSRLPTWGEPLLQWMDPQDPTLILFSLDDATESIERESLDEGISSMMDVLNQARGVLRDVVTPTGQVSA